MNKDKWGKSPPWENHPVGKRAAIKGRDDLKQIALVGDVHGKLKRLKRLWTNLERVLGTAVSRKHNHALHARFAVMACSTDRMASSSIPMT